jgi:hypothetical protein
MAVMHVQRSLPASLKESGPGRGSLIRCPNCSTHFSAGGEVDEPDAYDREREETDRFMDETDEYSGRGTDRSRESGFAQGGRVGYARGGVVDGAGKVDGIHRTPSECSHLADGGVCRHLAPSRRRAPGEDYADHRIRNFAGGGRVQDSFPGYLAQRRAARRGK